MERNVLAVTAKAVAFRRWDKERKENGKLGELGQKKTVGRQNSNTKMGRDSKEKVKEARGRRQKDTA